MKVLIIYKFLKDYIVIHLYGIEDTIDEITIKLI